jgi:hypothetical protein
MSLALRRDAKLQVVREGVNDAPSRVAPMMGAILAAHTRFS